MLAVHAANTLRYSAAAFGLRVSGHPRASSIIKLHSILITLTSLVFADVLELQGTRQHRRRRAMTDRAVIEGLINHAYETRNGGNVDAIVALFQPDARFVLAGSPTTTAVAGTARGHRELRPALAGLVAGFQFIQRDILSMVIDGDQAAVHSRVSLRYIPNNKTVTTDLLDLFKFADGKIVELVEFADTALVNVLMR
jgi:ketosteroid isomerase-like protein